MPLVAGRRGEGRGQGAYRLTFDTPTHLARTKNPSGSDNGVRDGANFGLWEGVIPEIRAEVGLGVGFNRRN